MEVAQEVVRAVVVSLAKTPLIAAQAPLAAARGIHGSFVDGFGVVERRIRGGGGEGEAEGVELRSRSAGRADLGVGVMRGSASDSIR